MDVSINTAQNVDISYHPAGIFHRITATIIDFAILGGISYIFGIAIALTKPDIGAFVVFFSFLSFYHLVCEFFLQGRSIGKITQNLRVVRLDGKKLSFWDYFLRWVFRLIDITSTFGAVAMLSIVMTKKMQRIGDIVAGTTVIRETKKVSLAHFTKNDTPEEYQVVFHEVTLLSDKDINVVREAMKEVKDDDEHMLLEPLSLKIKELTGIQTNMGNLTFIKTIIKDYQHLTKM